MERRVIWGSRSRISLRFMRATESPHACAALAWRSVPYWAQGTWAGGADHHRAARRRRAAVHALLRGGGGCRKGRADRRLARSPERKSEDARGGPGGCHPGLRPQAGRVSPGLTGWHDPGGRYRRGFVLSEARRAVKARLTLSIAAAIISEK